MKRAAISLVEHPDGGGRLLCVWNTRYEGWSLPGGLVEEGESIGEAQARELREETGLETVSARQIFTGPAAQTKPNRASYVHVFQVNTRGEPVSVELNSAITWLTRAEFLELSPFSEFYRQVFALVAETARKR